MFFLTENPSAISLSGGDEFEMRSNRPYVQLDPRGDRGKRKCLPLSPLQQRLFMWESQKIR